MDTHDAQALQYYQALLAEFYPPALAIALVQERYRVWLDASSMTLPVVREALVAVQEAHPDIKRDAGRTIAAIDRKKRVGRER